MTAEHPFSRLELLVGRKCLDALANTRVALFGVGGVGSWCAEGLVRSGIGHLTVVDSDVISVTNINRQLQATSASTGKPKVEEIWRRLCEINPLADINTVQRIYNWETRETFGIGGYDYVIDAIDSLSGKVDLIMNASAAGATLFSALGAAAKLDPTRVRVSSIWKSDRCRLGRFVRKRLRRWGFKGDFMCVWSDEGPGIDGIDADDVISTDDNINTDCDIKNYNSAGPTNKTVNGSSVSVTAVFGFTLSSLVVRDVIDKTNKK